MANQLKNARGKPKSHGKCGKDAQGTQLVEYKGQCMHPNHIRVLNSRSKIRFN